MISEVLIDVLSQLWSATDCQRTEVLFALWVSNGGRSESFVIRWLGSTTHCRAIRPEGVITKTKGTTARRHDDATYNPPGSSSGNNYRGAGPSARAVYSLDGHPTICWRSPQNRLRRAFRGAWRKTAIESRFGYRLCAALHGATDVCSSATRPIDATAHSG